MSQFERKVVPLSEIDGKEIVFSGRRQTTRTLKIRSNLPDFVDKSKIGVRPGRFLGMMKTGAMSGLLVEGRQGRTSVEIPEIVGGGPGGAYAGNRLAEARPTPSHGRDELPEDSVQRRLFDSKVIVDLSEIFNAMQQEKAPARDTKALAKALNQSTRKIIREEGIRNILPETGIDFAGDFIVDSGSFVNSFVNGEFVGGSGLIGKLEVFSILYLMTIAGVNITKRLYDMVHKYDAEGLRMSLLPGTQYDRVVTLTVKSKLFPLFTALPKKSS